MHNDGFWLLPCDPPAWMKPEVAWMVRALALPARLRAEEAGIAGKAFADRAHGKHILGKIMEKQRRKVLKSGSGAALLGLLATAGVIRPGMALAESNRTAFEARSMAATLKAIGAASLVDSTEVQLSGPDIAENGAAVHLGISSTLPNVTMIAILVEKNPNPLAVAFRLPEGTQANVQTRVKMAQSSNVYVLVKAGGRFFMANKEIRVTLGGCGG